MQKYKNVQNWLNISTENYYIFNRQVLKRIEEIICVSFLYEKVFLFKNIFFFFFFNMYVRSPNPKRQFKVPYFLIGIKKKSYSPIIYYVF